MRLEWIGVGVTLQAEKGPVCQLRHVVQAAGMAAYWQYAESDC